MTRAPTPDAPRCGACKQALTRQRDGIYRCTTFLCQLSLGATPRRPPDPLTRQHDGVYRCQTFLCALSVGARAPKPVPAFVYLRGPRKPSR